MFVGFVLGLLALVVYLALYRWSHYHRFSAKGIHKALKAIQENISLGQWKEAASALRPLLKNHRGGKEAALCHIRVLHGTGRLQEALNASVEAGRHFPEELLFRLEEGALLLELGNPKEALAAFTVCNPILRTEQEFFLLATAYSQTGRYKAALETLDPSLRQTKNEKILELAARCALQEGLLHEAIGLCHRALNGGSTARTLLLCLAESYRKKGEWEKSEKTYRRLLTTDPVDIEATCGLGRCMREKGQAAKALIFYQNAPAWGTQHPTLLQEAGLCALHMHDYGWAAPYFESLLRSSQGDLDTLARYGFCLEKLRRWEEAEQVYLDAIKRYPTAPEGYCGLAWLFGVGQTTHITPAEGLFFAQQCVEHLGTPLAWEILSACEARVGHFATAYKIQESLSAQDTSLSDKIRRQELLRTLRKHLPLDALLVQRTHTHVA